jgi:hypothetical protein
LLPNWTPSADSTVERLRHQLFTYTDGQGGAPGYLANLGSLALNLPRVAGSLVEPRAVWADHLLAPSFWVYGALVLLGLAWPLRRGNPLPALSGLSFLLLLPVFTGKFEPIFNGRYLTPLLPLAFAGFGGLVADLRRALAVRPLRLTLAVAAAALALYPLLPLVSYEQRAVAEGQIDLDLIQSAAAVDAAQRRGEPILLDEALGRRGLPADGDLLMNLRVFLELREVPYRVGPASAGRLEAELGGARTALLVVAQPYDRALDDRYRFTPIEEKSSGRYGVYRIERKS